MGGLRIGIMGAGSIGCYVGGRLLATDAATVSFVGREHVGDELARHGLTVTDTAGKVTVPPPRIQFSTDPVVLASCDVILVSVKSGQTEDTGRQLAEVIGPGSVIVSLQNGVRNPQHSVRFCPTRYSPEWSTSTSSLVAAVCSTAA